MPRGSCVPAQIPSLASSVECITVMLQQPSKPLPPPHRYIHTYIHTYIHIHIHIHTDDDCVRESRNKVCSDVFARARTHTHTLDAPVCSKSRTFECESAPKNRAAALVRAPNCQELMLAGRVGAGTQPAAALGSPLPMCVFSVCS